LSDDGFQLSLVCSENVLTSFSVNGLIVWHDIEFDLL
jgi:hypothetical protein